MKSLWKQESISDQITEAEKWVARFEKELGRTISIIETLKTEAVCHEKQAVVAKLKVDYYRSHLNDISERYAEKQIKLAALKEAKGKADGAALKPDAGNCGGASVAAEVSVAPAQERQAAI